MKLIKFFALLIFGLILFAPDATHARENVDYWYIKDFQTEIVVGKDSSLEITENIVADCGSCVGKHGIYRILPTRVYESKSQKIDTPITLESITDFSGTPLQYSASKSLYEHTVTWKIGDSDKTVSGVNNYRIKYKVQNAIRFGNPGFDEFYWNLLGNFWDLEIDSFTGKIVFPNDINLGQSEINLYSGDFGANGNTKASSDFIDNNTLQVKSKQTLKAGEGITVSVTLPKNIFSPYQPGLTSYLHFGFLLILILVFYFCFSLWRRYGRDPKINPTVVPEFEIPEKLPPIEMGLVSSNGTMHNTYLSAGIINLAVGGALKIEKLEKKGIFGSDDYKLIRLKDGKSMQDSEKVLLEKLFAGKKEVLLSDLKNEFYTDIPAIKDAASKPLTAKKYIQPGSLGTMVLFFVVAGVFVFLTVLCANIDFILALSFGISALLIFIFGIFMPQRTLEGTKLNQRIKGFRLYMETAEKYRQRFNEKENIFEKYLPYAVLFGITELWAKKMEALYGKDYFTTYHPVWFYGAAFSNFSATDFNSAISEMSANMSSTLSSAPSSSGSGGGGFSGGGGGGGGGGGW